MGAVYESGAEGSRTLTGTDLNRVPLPIGLRPHATCAACLSVPAAASGTRRFGTDHLSRPISFRTRATWPVALTLRQAFTILPSGPITNVERMTPIMVRP